MTKLFDLKGGGYSFGYYSTWEQDIINWINSPISKRFNKQSIISISYDKYMVNVGHYHTTDKWLNGCFIIYLILLDSYLVPNKQDWENAISIVEFSDKKLFIEKVQEAINIAPRYIQQKSLL